MARTFACRTFGNVSGSSPAAPATPTITVTDNANGTATVTVASSSAGSSNVASYATFNGTSGALGGWTTGDTGSGDGSITFAVANGLYVFRVVSTLNSQTAVSNLVYERITDGTESKLEQILTAVQTRIQSLSLAGVTSTNIVILPVAIDTPGNIPAKPAIVIAPGGAEQISPSAGTNIQDDIVYPVLVGIVASDNRDVTAATRAKYTLWRERIIKAFRSQRLTGAASVLTVNINPKNIVEPPAWAENQWVSGVVLQCVSRETRGVA